MLRAAVVLALALAVTGRAGAATLADLAASALGRDPVFVHPEMAEALGTRDAARVRNRIAAAALPVFVAVLPSRVASEHDGIDRVPRALARRLARRGVVVVVTPRTLHAYAEPSLGVDVDRIATDVRAEAGGSSLPYVLIDLVDRIDRIASGARGDRITPNGSLVRAGRSVPFLPIAVMLGAALALIGWRASRERFR